MVRFNFGKLKDLASNAHVLAIVIVVGVVVAVFIAGLAIGNNRTKVISTADTGANSAQQSVLSANNYMQNSVNDAKTATTSSTNNKGVITNPDATAKSVLGTATSKTAVVKTVSNGDGTTTKQVATYKSIPFAAQTQNEVNLRRGMTQVVPGHNGIQTTLTAITYDSNGQELSRRVLSDGITTQPTAQITKVGISDFNLNSDTVDGSEFGEMCFPEDFANGSDGCIGTPSDRYFSAVQISGTFYVKCVSDTFGYCGNEGPINISPMVAIQNDTFTYEGTTYRADPRAGGGESRPLTADDCVQYGLACGRW